MKRPTILASLALVIVLGVSPASAVSGQQPVGSTLVVVNLVTAAFNRDTRSLAAGDSVHQDELIEVGLDARSEIALEDETKLALGPGSRLTLDKFVYDPAKKTGGSIVLDLVKGTLRFVTGVAEKPTYLIKTPAAAITVRGTIFDVYVEDNGLAWLLLHEGAVEVCNLRGVCRVLDEPGRLIRIGDDGDVGPPVRWASLDGNDRVPFDDAFPFVADAPGFDSDPVLSREAILLGPGVRPPKRGGDVKRKAESKPEKRSTKPTKAKRRAEVPAKPRKKRQRKAERRGSDGPDLFDTTIGIGVGIGIGRIGGRRSGGYPGGHRPGGSYGGSNRTGR